MLGIFSSFLGLELETVHRQLSLQMNKGIGPAAWIFFITTVSKYFSTPKAAVRTKRDIEMACIDIDASKLKLEPVANQLYEC